MPTKPLVLALATLIALGPVTARAQDDTAAPPSDTDMVKAQREAQQKMEAWIKATAEFTKDIRLTEADFKKWIELAPSFDKIGEGEKEDEDVFEKCYRDGKFSYDYILKHPLYAKWVKEHGVDPTQWLKKHTRVTMLVMREEGLKHIEMAEKQLPQQLKQIEAMKGQVDEATYRQMKQAVESSVAALKKTKEMYASLPKPTADEAQLLKKYGSQIRQAMGDDEEDEEEDYDDDEDDDEDME